MALEELEIIREDSNDDKSDTGEKRAKSKRVLRFNVDQGLQTLERECNLKISSFDTRHEIDPLFSKTTRKFDEMGPSTLLSSSLAASSCLILQLDSKVHIDPVTEYGKVSL